MKTTIIAITLLLITTTCANAQTHYRLIPEWPTSTAYGQQNPPGSVGNPYNIYDSNTGRLIGRMESFVPMINPTPHEWRTYGPDSPLNRWDIQIYDND